MFSSADDKKMKSNVLVCLGRARSPAHRRVLCSPWRGGALGVGYSVAIFGAWRHLWEW